MKSGLSLSRCWLVLAAWLLSGPVSAYPNVSFDRLSVEHGLAQSAVQDMVQDDAGFLWVGTQYGLSRFDGYRFHTFRHEPAEPNSLSHSRIHSLHMGRDGKLWIGSMDGVDRLDPETLEIERVVPFSAPGEPAINFGLRADSMLEDRRGNVLIRSDEGIFVYHRLFGWFTRARFEGIDGRTFGRGQMAVDGSGRVWLLNPDGLWRLDRSLRTFRRVLGPAGFADVRGNQELAVLSAGELALASAHGLLLFDPERERVVERVRPSEHGHPGDRVVSVAEDSEGHLWMVLPNALIELDSQGQWRVRHRFGGSLPETEPVRGSISLAEDGRGYIWIGVRQGVGLVSPDRETFRFFRYDPADRQSLAASPATSRYMVLVDDFGVVWIGGGLGGLSRFAPQSVRFETIRDRTPNRSYQASNIVRSLLETRSGEEIRLWTGLQSGGIRVWRRRDGEYREVIHRLNRRAEPPYRLPAETVWRLKAAPDADVVWAATDRGLCVLDGDSAAVIDCHEVTRDGRSASVRALAFPSPGTLAVGTGSELRLLDLDRQRTGIRERRAISLQPAGSTRNKYRVSNMLVLGNGQLAVATGSGLALFDPETENLQWIHPAGRPGHLARNYLFGLAEHPAGTLWLGTAQRGLARMSLESARRGQPDFEWFDRDDGLVDDTVYAITVDGEGHLWISSNRGLSRMDPAGDEMHHFTPRDGLQGFEFNNTVVHAGESGLLYFGGIRGANAFRPEEIAPHPQPPNVVLESIKINGKPAAPDRDELELSYDENALTLSFVGLHFVDPERNRYAYRLAGVDDDWIDAGHTRQVRYPNLAPGHYRFHVRAANSDGVWSADQQLLEFSIAAPPWRTPWAYAAYSLAVALAIGLLFAIQSRRRRELESTVAERTRDLLEQKRVVDRQALELEEALAARTTLFANVSHEFRTPLTLIEAGLERLDRAGVEPESVSMARRYVHRLLRLVDQLLILSRLQSEPKRPLAEPWAVSPLVDMTVEAFRSLADQKGIELESDIKPGWFTPARQGDVERILLNLIGNALKFCRKGDRVEVSLHGAGQTMTLTVADTGPGMDESQKKLIFDRFHRLPAHEAGHVTGTGIGLALVREAVNANGGEIVIDSQPGRGTVFRVDLPARQDESLDQSGGALSAERLSLELDSLDERDARDTANRSPGKQPENAETVLIAEDNTDLRSHLRELLVDRWQVLEAADGREALQLARDRMPDAVVSDIMMPGMDGLELLRKLRDDLRTSHLPVLLLTARQDDRTRLEGYSLSADDFLPKPFDPEELRLRVARMIDNRRRMRRRLALTLESDAGLEDAGVNSGLPELSERDQRLLARVREWLEVHYNDPEANVKNMAAHAAVEPRTLQRKLKALTGRTPAAYLQAYRLKCARELLRTTKRPVQDIATSCGFSSPQYFTRVFRRAEGQSPSAWRGDPV